MFFIGQDHIMYQLGDILQYAYDTKSGVSILFRGASGYGKTELAKKCCKFLVKDDYEYCLGNNIKFSPDIWVHFIDEIHLCENPENFYPIIDGGKYVFIFATNFDSVLPEALTNRCNCFTFVDYSTSELVDIFRAHSKLEFKEDVIKYIVEVSGRNPRVIVKTFAKTLYMHYYKNKQEFLAKTNEQLIEDINILFGIERGLDRICRQYLDTLSELGGRGSINLISSMMRLDQNSIKYQVEPVLLYKKLIKITSRGRELL